MSEAPPHSALYFGDTRDHWWNEDFVALCARRVELGRRRRVLDVGTGYGHWARVLLPHLPAGAALTGVDPEARSIAEAERRTRAQLDALGLDRAVDWRVASAESLPFPDGHFDLVTAQTVLIHVRDVARAIDELVRVLAPGGLLLLAEPNNLANTMGNLVEGPALDPAEVLPLIELELRIQRGKYLLGEGDNSAGEYLQRYLDPGRFSRVRSWLCDRPYPIAPPYDTPSAQAEIAEHRELLAQGWYGRPTDEARRYFRAGGGDEAAFERAWSLGLARARARLAGVDAGTFASGGGGVFYLIAAERR